VYVSVKKPEVLKMDIEILAKFTLSVFRSEDAVVGYRMTPQAVKQEAETGGINETENAFINAFSLLEKRGLITLEYNNFVLNMLILTPEGHEQLEMIDNL
jgi:hypothetical protein